MQLFEQEYAKQIMNILNHGEYRTTRNGTTYSTFGNNLTIPVGNKIFPIIQGRKMYPKGILGELAAMLRKPKSLADFEKWGCNYWEKWAKPDGSINIDYGNAWHANGQIEHLKRCLAFDPTDRRMIISGWRPENLPNLDLPCCHLLYQFYVREDKYIDILWYQRSVDMLIGLPSDIVFAAAWLIAIANEFDYIPGNIHMSLGDCHVYSEHVEGAEQYVGNVSRREFLPVTYAYNGLLGADFCEFEPEDIELDYNSCAPIKFLLKE